MSFSGNYDTGNFAFAKLLRSNKYADLKILLGVDQFPIFCHKNILCSASGYVERECTSIEELKKKERPKAKPFTFGAKGSAQPAEEKDVIEISIPMVEKPIMDFLIRFMYGQGFDIAIGKRSTQMNMEIYAAADSLEMPDMKRYIVAEYNRVFQMRQGIWSHQDIINIIETVIRTTVHEAVEFHGGVKELLNSLFNFIDLRPLLDHEDFQTCLNDNMISKALVITLLNRKWNCKACNADKMLGSHVTVVCTRCHELLAVNGGISHQISPSATPIKKEEQTEQ